MSMYASACIITPDKRTCYQRTHFKPLWDKPYLPILQKSNYSCKKEDVVINHVSITFKLVIGSNTIVPLCKCLRCIRLLESGLLYCELSVRRRCWGSLVAESWSNQFALLRKYICAGSVKWACLTWGLLNARETTVFTAQSSQLVTSSGIRSSDQWWVGLQPIIPDNIYYY